VPYLLVRHKVTDFSTWKAAYDAHLPARQKAGLKQEHLLRSIDDPNEVILLFEAEDVRKNLVTHLTCVKPCRRLGWLINRIFIFSVSGLLTAAVPGEAHAVEAPGVRIERLGLTSRGRDFAPRAAIFFVSWVVFELGVLWAG
jgi:hypothetical protein